MLGNNDVLLLQNTKDLFATIRTYCLALATATAGGGGVVPKAVLEGDWVIWEKGVLDFTDTLSKIPTPGTIDKYEFFRQVRNANSRFNVAIGGISPEFRKGINYSSDVLCQLLDHEYFLIDKLWVFHDHIFQYWLDENKESQKLNTQLQTEIAFSQNLQTWGRALFDRLENDAPIADRWREVLGDAYTPVDAEGPSSRQQEPAHP